MSKISDKNSQPLEGEALQRHIDKALAVEMPQGGATDLLYALSKRVFKPVIQGQENIPEEPCLFVANHSLFALDGWLLGPVWIKELDRFPRGLGDRFLFFNEKVEDFVLKMGGVLGHPEVCDALMENGCDVMVFPGGAHEAVKPDSEKYTLQWRERYGFVRLAAKHGYTIQPMGIVGPDEFYGHLIEGQDIPDSLPGRILQRMGLLTEDTRPDMLPPIPVGALGTLVPKPQRCYIGFGEPISLAEYEGKTLTKKQMHTIRSSVAEEIEGQLAQLLLLREQNRSKDGLLRRILTI